MSIKDQSIEKLEVALVNYQKSLRKQEVFSAEVHAKLTDLKNCLGESGNNGPELLQAALVKLGQHHLDQKKADL